MSNRVMSNREQPCGSSGEGARVAAKEISNNKNALKKTASVHTQLLYV